MVMFFFVFVLTAIALIIPAWAIGTFDKIKNQTP